MTKALLSNVHGVAQLPEEVWRRYEEATGFEPLWPYIESLDGTGSEDTEGVLKRTDPVLISIIESMGIIADAIFDGPIVKDGFETPFGAREREIDLDPATGKLVVKGDRS